MPFFVTHADSRSLSARERLVVLTRDGCVAYLQDELDWTQFAVVLHRSDVNKLSEIDRLDAAAMRLKLRE